MKWQPTHEWVLRVPLIDGGGFGSKDHDRIAQALDAVLEHMGAAGIDSRGGVLSSVGAQVASWRIEEIATMRER